MTDTLPPLPRVPTLPFAVFDEFGAGADDRVQDYVAAAVEHAADDIARLRRALHDIAEEWAGAECGEPVHAQEAYAIGLAKRMYALAVEGLRPTNAELTGEVRSNDR